MRIEPGTVFLQATGKQHQPRPAEAGKSFRQVFRDALQYVNDLQLEADKLDRQLAAGTVENIHEVTIAAEKAALALELTVQIRNRLLEAYQEFMRMTV
ncbi:MAG: flagellar hook-basal body complex protein FliE [Firmicutes bacterium]|jgi:flagellar hook-basal body complex protein FliE|nr:flagellar hook-basal body complex protein FliE [Bacillota bacterium]